MTISIGETPYRATRHSLLCSLVLHLRSVPGTSIGSNFRKERSSSIRLADAMDPGAKRWIKYLIAIVVGNVVYFLLAPHLPPAAQHRPYRADIGLFVDLWFCVAVYGLIELLVFLARRYRR